MKSDDNNSKSWVPYTIASCSAVLLYFVMLSLGSFVGGMSGLFTVLKPVIIGIVVAYLVNPLVRLFEECFKFIRNEKARYITAMITALLVIIVFFVILISILIPQLTNSILMFAANFNSYAVTVSASLNDMAALARRYNLDISLLNTFGNDFVSFATSFISRNVNRIINTSFSVGGNAFNFLLGLILALYFLADKKRLLNGFKRIMRSSMRPEHYKAAMVFLRRCNSILSKYVVSDIIDALIVGVVNFIFMCIMKMPYGTLISVVVAVTNLIPTFGPFIGGGIGAFILFFADTADVIPFLIFTQILQLIDGYVIKPKLFGDSLGVPGAWILVSIIVGSRLVGVYGILLAIPVAAIVNYIFDEFMKKREHKMAEEAKASAAAAAAEAAKAKEAAPAELPAGENAAGGKAAEEAAAAAEAETETEEAGTAEKEPGSKEA